MESWRRLCGGSTTMRRNGMASLNTNMLAGVFTLIGMDDAKPAKSVDLQHSEFVGIWEVEDSNGELFEITMSADGVADANRAGEGMAGTWVIDGISAVITWDTGWTTKITRTGNLYVKTAYDSTATAPTNTSQAEKIG
jgi:hypothetical protein